MLVEILEIIKALPSQHLIYGVISTVLCIAVAWVYSKSSEKLKIIIIQAVSYLVIFNEIAFQINMIFYGIWSIETSLPLEMCYISALLIPFYSMNNNSRALKNWFFFAGFCGSLFAFINTNLSEFEQIYISIHYFFAHGLVIFIALSIIADGYRPTWNDYYDVIKWTTVLVLIIIIINILLGSNYMFTFEKPKGINFTLLMPGWPFYFLIMLLVGLTSYTLMMGFMFFPNKDNAQNDH
tara:strand:+ start:585 stop:1298 length:714 start_codon:yes stop_codon:yes gene_type:complete